MNLPPPAYPPSDQQIRLRIIQVCDRIIQFGEDEEFRFLDKVFHFPMNY